MGFLDDLNSLAGGFSGTYFPMMRWNREQNRADELLNLQKGMKDLEMQRLGLDIQDRQDARPFMDAIKNRYLSMVSPSQDPGISPQSTPPREGSGPTLQPTAYKGMMASALPQDKKDLLDYWGRYQGIPEGLLPFLHGIAAVESGGNTWAKNDNIDPSTGKVKSSDHGFMQINDKNLPVYLKPGENIYDPSVSARIGATILGTNLNLANGDVNKALGAYNTGKLNPAAPYVGKVLQAMGATPDNPGTFQVAAAPTGTMSDASGPPTGLGKSSPTPGMTTSAASPSAGILGTNDPAFVNLVIAGAMSGNKYLMEASKSLLSGMKSGVDVLNSRNPEYMANLDVLKALNIEQGKRGIDIGMPKMKDNLNLINQLAPKVMMGTATENEVRQYTLAYNDEYNKVQTLPDGSQVKLTPPPVNLPLPPGYNAQVAGEKPMNPTDAGKQAAVVEAAKAAAEFEAALFPGGKFDSLTALKMHLPFSDAGQWKAKIFNAIDSVMKARTGAAASASEVRSYMDMFMPGPTDSEATAKAKIGQLKGFLGTALDLSGSRGATTPQAAPTLNDLNKKYGVE